MTTPTPPPHPPSRSWSTWDAHHRFAIASAAAVVTAVLLRGRTGASTEILATWVVFAAFSVALIWAVILTQDPYEMRRVVSLEDSSRTVLFVIVVAAAAASLLAVFMTLGPVRSLSQPRLAGHLALSVAAVGLAWALVHTVFAMRYAHSYYEGAQAGPRGSVRGGLVFPQEGEPDYQDFAYFAFVIGMTCQVSDVQVSSRPIRRLALWHGLIAFGFNTAILALFVNLVAGLL